MGLQIIPDSKEFENRIDQKLNLLKDSLLSELKQEFQPKMPEEFLTRIEVANLLKVNVNTVDRWSKEDKLKRYGIGDRIFYKRSEVEESIVRLK